MGSIDEHINLLNAKIQEVIKKYASLQKENMVLKTELHRAKESEQQLRGKLGFLEMQSDILKASAGSMAPDEKAAFEKRINQYLRDIDKCIAILNN